MLWISSLSQVDVGFRTWSLPIWLFDMDTQTPSLSSLTTLRPQWFHYGLRYVEVLIMTNTSGIPSWSCIFPHSQWIQEIIHCIQGYRESQALDVTRAVATPSLNPKLCQGNMVYVHGRKCLQEPYLSSWMMAFSASFSDHVCAHKTRRNRQKRLGVDGKNPAANDTAINSLQCF